MLRVLGWCCLTAAGILLLPLLSVGLGAAGSFSALMHDVVAHWQFWTGAFVVLTSLASAASLHEAYHWNHGKCRAYDEPWEYSDLDSQGGRGYKCRDKTIWVSWPGVDRVRA